MVDVKGLAYVMILAAALTPVALDLFNASKWFNTGSIYTVMTIVPILLVVAIVYKYTSGTK